MTTRTITAIYDSEAEAREARAQLASCGVDDDDVRIVSNTLTATPVGSDRREDGEGGLWDSIKDFFIGDDDRPVYSEGVRRGGYLLTARVDDDLSDEAIQVLERTNAVDLDERTEQWRAEGWTTADDADTTLEQTSTMRSSDLRDTGATRDQQTIPVAEERLRVGKREIDKGGVRVRSYVVEEPVREQVTLRSERVQVEQRPASGSTAARGDEMFREQTIEMTERAEEAVVAKDVVVTGEVVVSKTADERTENIEESVRRTEIDVDDSRKGADPSASRTSRTPRKS
jgi:uncharacterized protein (TIGR02271 family)